MIQFKVENNPISMTVERVAVVGEGAYERGYDKGYDDGHTEGYNKGTSDGYTTGYNQGNSDGYETGYTKGNSDGYTNGYETGYDSGYTEGVESVEVYLSPQFGLYYTPHMDVSAATEGLVSGMYRNCVELISFKATNSLGNGWQFLNTFMGCKKLESVVLTRATNPQGGNTNTFSDCPALKEVTFGGIGYPVTDLTQIRGSYANAITFTIYVDAETIADISTKITNSGYCGFKNATIIYRNSTTGEVITE